MTKFTFLMAWEHILKDNYEPDIFLSLTLNEHNVLLAEVSPAYSLQLTLSSRTYSMNSIASWLK